MVRERMLVLLPKYEIYLHGQYRGCVCKLLSLRPRYRIDYLGWQVAGDLLELDYRISDAAGRPIASVAKEPLRLTDTYVIHVPRSENALAVLMFVLAMDAERCSRGK